LDDDGILRFKISKIYEQMEQLYFVLHSIAALKCLKIDFGISCIFFFEKS